MHPIYSNEIDEEYLETEENLTYIAMSLTNAVDEVNKDTWNRILFSQ